MGCDGRVLADALVIAAAGSPLPLDGGAAGCSISTAGCDAGRAALIVGCDGRVPADALDIAGCDGRVPAGSLLTGGVVAGRPVPVGNGGGCTPSCVLRTGGGGGGPPAVAGCDGRFPDGSPVPGWDGSFPAGSPPIAGCDAGLAVPIDGCDCRVPDGLLPTAGCDAARCRGCGPSCVASGSCCDAARCRGCDLSCVASGSCSGDAGTSALAVAGPPRPLATGGEEGSSAESSVIFPLSLKVRTTYSSTKNAPYDARVPTLRAAPETASRRRRPGGSPRAFRAYRPETGTAGWMVQV